MNGKISESEKDFLNLYIVEIRAKNVKKSTCFL